MNWLQDILPQIGYAFVCSFWQMALLLAIYKIAAFVYLPAPADKFRFALLLTIGGSLWFLYTMLFSKPATDWYYAAVFTQTENLPGALPGLIRQSLYWLGWAYMGMLFYSCLQGRYQWKAAIHMKKGEPYGKAPVAWRLFVDKYAALLGIKQKVLLKIYGNFSPATFGFLKPVILLPASCLTGLNTAQLEAILLHELAHIRRNDYLSAWVLQVANMLLYFNPFMRQLVREAKNECENACDDLVMQFQYNPVSYAQALLAVAKNGEQLAWALQAQGGGQHLLLNRISRLIGQPVKSNRLSWKTLVLPVSAFLLIAATGLNLRPKKNTASANPGTFNKETVVFKPEMNWQNSLLKARTAILAAATNRAIAENREKISRIEAEVSRQEKLLHAELTGNIPHPESPANALILSTNWAGEQNMVSDEESEIKPQWQRFNEYLGKLEEMGDLEEGEWQELAKLITLYADIRHAIYKETARSQNPAGFAVEQESETLQKVLVLVYDESTGLLCASLMAPGEINEAYWGEKVPENRQPVILLRKKAEGSKKVISL